MLSTMAAIFQRTDGDVARTAIYFVSKIERTRSSVRMTRVCGDPETRMCRVRDSRGVRVKGIVLSERAGLPVFEKPAPTRSIPDDDRQPT